MNSKTLRQTKIPKKQGHLELSMRQDDIAKGFDILKLPQHGLIEYTGAKNYSRRFVRCTKVRHTQVVYSASSM